MYGRRQPVECGDLSPLCSIGSEQSGDKSPHSTAGRLFSPVHPKSSVID